MLVDPHGQRSQRTTPFSAMGSARGDLPSEQGEREGDYESEPLALPGRVRGVGASEDQQFVLPHGPPQKIPATQAPMK